MSSLSFLKHDHVPVLFLEPEKQKDDNPNKHVAS